mmetsp:Transcript_33263/g.88046  ORF Transcript_33263/g.88046 Transcript_33263/m.88046 type:complete len:229 (+) Transcript_33263:3673-4359(+)
MTDVAWMIWSTPSKDLASTVRDLAFASRSTGRRNSPGSVCSVTCRPAPNVWYSRKKNVISFSVSFQSASWSKSIQSVPSPLPAVLNEITPFSPEARSICGILRTTRARLARSFAGRTVMEMTVCCIDTGGLNMTWRNSHWKPGSIRGVLLIDSFRMEANSPTVSEVGASSVNRRLFSADETGRRMQQILTSVSTVLEMIRIVLTVSRNLPMVMSYRASERKTPLRYVL